MPRKETKQKPQIQAVKDPPIFSEHDVLRIIEKTIHTPQGHKRALPQIPDTKTLAGDLNASYKTYQGWRNGWDKIPTQRILLKNLKDAILKTNKVIKSYEITLSDIQSLMQINRSNVLSATEDAIEASLTDLSLIFENLNYISDLVSADNHDALKRGGRTAETDFMSRVLTDVYSKNFGTGPSRSTAPNGKPTGPMIRFIRACMDHLKINVTDEAIASSRPR